MGKKRKKRDKRRSDVASRAYEGAMSVPTRRHPIGSNLSQDASAERAFPYLREWGRYLDENSAQVVGILDELVKNIVGTGIITIPKPKRPDGSIDETLGAQIIERWKRWTRQADVTGELSWHDAQRMICRAWMRDGEEFIQHINGRYPFQPGDTPYRVELLESDFVPYDLHDRDRNWLQGIQQDTWRRPTAYAVYLDHPGNFGQGMRPVTFNDVKIVDAQNVTHVKCVKRWPARRGISVLHPAITNLYDIKDMKESERIKNRILASWTAAIQKGPDTPGNERTDESGRRFLEMAGGTIIDTLAKDETIVGVGPEYPQPGIPEYLQNEIREVAAGTGTRYSSISRTYSGNYAAQRQELVESEGHYKMREDQFVQRVCRVVYERWLFAELVSGQTVAPPASDFEMISQAEFRGPITPWIDPLKEAQADALMVAENFQSREQIQIKRGASPEIVGQDPPTPKPALAPRQLSLVSDDDEEEEAA